jgi:hypothetical protein
MLRTRMLARLGTAVLVSTTLQTVVAEEPTAPTPPATSIREWRTTPNATSAATPVVPATSIREWRTTPTATPVATPCPNAAATPLTAAAPKPAVSATGPKLPITISITSMLRNGNLVVLLDGVPVFNEKFQKPIWVLSQTTSWDPLQVASGTHRLSAKVYGKKKTYISKDYDLQLSGTKGSALRFVMQGDKLTVKLAS